jgi:hypothetical protein
MPFMLTFSRFRKHQLTSLRFLRYLLFNFLALRQNLWVELAEFAECYERFAAQAQQQQGRPALRLPSRHTSQLG